MKVLDPERLLRPEQNMVKFPIKGGSDPRGCNWLNTGSYAFMSVSLILVERCSVIEILDVYIFFGGGNIYL